jgi:hypothetical protein
LLALAGCAERGAVPNPAAPGIAPASSSHGEPSLHPLSASAPADQPVGVRTRREADTLEAAIAPYVAQARASYPGARKRFLDGLPAGQHFFVTTRLHDDERHFEQVFIAVHRIEGGEIQGVIQSELNVVRRFHAGQLYRFPETEIIDWTIARPDGTEEGNVVGKFLDTYHPAK